MSLNSHWLHSVKRHRRNLASDTDALQFIDIGGKRLTLRRRDHDSRQNSALRSDKFCDAFAAEREHFVQLRLRKGRFLTGALHLYEFAVLGSH